ncbi:hypothetical protein EOL71_02935 [Candidatus Saccharibacteria bacterium]|nr:hypothetical protein [Candidatus Saccharibacteria bacterium]
MIAAVIGRKPKNIGSATLYDYQLCIQGLDDIPTSGANPREILREAWGDTFISYTIRHHKGEKVTGTIFKMTAYERKMLDAWELVPEGWQDSIVVRVKAEDGAIYRARTQCLPNGHNHGYTSIGRDYNPWLMPKQDFVRIANDDIKRYESYVY